ncbi:MAG: sacsin N-terminal ATP-binding-like domain-containing protein [Allosphingosinicella sp.]
MGLTDDVEQSVLKLVTDAPRSSDSEARADPAWKLTKTLQDQLRNAVDAALSGLLTYESLRNVSEVIGGEYGDRVIFELVQNAHDAHEDGEEGAILLKLVIDGAENADLFIANMGKGFSWENVNAIRNIGVSSKSVGEGIGNKGLGFRSVETLTEDPRIYSQQLARPAEAFDGYCFRFAGREEVRRETALIADATIADRVATVLPRYLAAVPLTTQPEEIRRFAKDGFATVVHLPLRSRNAVSVAREQANALADIEVPLLLFLDRLARVTIEIHEAGKVKRKTLTRKVLDRPEPATDTVVDYEIVGVGPGTRRYLIARRAVDRVRLLEAIEASIAKEPQLARWRDWQGEPRVAVAVSLSNSDIEGGRTYNFLPMAAEVPSPIRGHVDAPFYASIDRRRANFDLPLNSFLLDELAETAVRAAAELKPISSKIGRNAIFDLAAWSPDDVLRLHRASLRAGLDWRDRNVVPAAGGQDCWTTFRAAYIWQEQGYKLLRVRRLIKAGIKDLADSSLESQRLDRLHRMLAVVNICSLPEEWELAEWIEAVASSLELDGSPLRTWATLYEESRKALPSVNALRNLANKAILKTRDGTVHKAMTSDGRSPVFIRDAIGTRDKDRAPLPPSSLSSKFAILDDGIAMSPEVTSDFLKAGLLRRYDALQVLQSVQSTFGDKPAPKRREAALRWAFDVWRAEGPKSEKILKTVDLHVETRGGWQRASSARFSEGWTSEGRKLSTYLSEAALISPDCARAANLLLLPEPKWAPKSDGARKQWTDFLRAAGVRDGLPLLADEDVPQSGTPIYTWNSFRSTQAAKLGRSSAWVASNSKAYLPNPYTEYSRRGDLWRVPGQVEHTQLPPEARQRLAELILILLAHEDQHWLHWKLGRYERWGTDQNECVLYTPAAIFIAGAPWMPIDGEADRFERPSRLWWSSDRRQRPPRYVDRPRERLAELIEEEKHLSAAMFSAPVSLRDWSRSEEVVRRLADLARAAMGLEPRDRVAFRKAYQAVWADVCGSELPLPADLPLAVVTSTGPTTLNGNVDDKPRVFVTGDPLQAETKAVIAAGQPVLELAEAEQVGPALERLAASGGFDALSIDPHQVGVLVDGEPMVVSLTDPLLVGDGLDWLPEAAVLANEVLGQALERQISSAAVDQRLRRVRLRRCGTIKLSVAGAAVEEVLPFYALPDDELPTLVVGDNQEITWSVLADAAPALSTLLDRRMRSLETLLLRLAARGVSPDPRHRPSDEALARALGCKVELVHEHSLALRTDGSFLVGRLLPVVACLTDLETALSIGEKLGDSALRSHVVEALATIVDRLPLAPSALLDQLARPDLAEVRRALHLDYGRLNEMLIALGERPLSNEGELRRLFDTWKDELAGHAVERLRRYFMSDFERGLPLDRYVMLRSLEFLEFQSSWVLDREQLDRSDVQSLLDARLDELVGEDVPRELEPQHQVRHASKRRLQRFIDDAAPVMGAWCFRNDQTNPWADGSLRVLKIVDQGGLLDFATVESGKEIATLVRANCWPKDMPHTVDPSALGLDPDDLHGEKRREQDRRQQAEIDRRTIKFADVPLDTRAKEFAQRLTELADAKMTDGGWLTRSRRKFSLVEQLQSDPRRGGPGGKGGKRRRLERVTDDVKSAMGFASEYLAHRFLQHKHRDRYSDRCWVSENRSLLEIDWEGDDKLGFDFRVQTVEVDWRYEVKSNLDDAFEFEFTQNEMRIAAECAADTTRRYRILYVPFVFDPTRWRVMELPNPMSAKGRSFFKALGTGATRLKFETS